MINFTWSDPSIITDNNNLTNNIDSKNQTNTKSRTFSTENTTSSNSNNQLAKDGFLPLSSPDINSNNQSNTPDFSTFDNNSTTNNDDINSDLVNHNDFFMLQDSTTNPNNTEPELLQNLLNNTAITSTANDQNKLIHLDPIPDFKDKSEIKPWLQKIFYPQGIELVIERSDNIKVVFKCKASKRRKKNQYHIHMHSNTNANANIQDTETNSSPNSPSSKLQSSQNISISTPTSNSNASCLLEKPKRKRLVSKYNTCPFRVRATYSLKRKKWNVVVLNNSHSHELKFNPTSEDYKKFKDGLRKQNDWDSVKKFDELEYRFKSNLPLVPSIPCDCGLTNEIECFDIVLPNTVNSNIQRQKLMLSKNHHPHQNSSIPLTTNNNLKKDSSIMKKKKFSLQQNFNNKNDIMSRNGNSIIDLTYAACINNNSTSTSLLVDSSQSSPNNDSSPITNNFNLIHSSHISNSRATNNINTNSRFNNDKNIIENRISTNANFLKEFDIEDNPDFYPTLLNDFDILSNTNNSSNNNNSTTNRSTFNEEFCDLLDPHSNTIMNMSNATNLDVPMNKNIPIFTNTQTTDLNEIDFTSMFNKFSYHSNKNSSSNKTNSQTTKSYSSKSNSSSIKNNSSIYGHQSHIRHVSHNQQTNINNTMNNPLIKNNNDISHFTTRDLLNPKEIFETTNTTKFNDTNDISSNQAISSPSTHGQFSNFNLIRELEKSSVLNSSTTSTPNDTGDNQHVNNTNSNTIVNISDNNNNQNHAAKSNINVNDGFSNSNIFFKNKEDQQLSVPTVSTCTINMVPILFQEPLPSHNIVNDDENFISEMIKKEQQEEYEHIHNNNRNNIGLSTTNMNYLDSSDLSNFPNNFNKNINPRNSLNNQRLNNPGTQTIASNTSLATATLGEMFNLGNSGNSPTTNDTFKDIFN
ncbi:hypothetical protein TBLA_0A02020 [Henningerozyma blattae CBS 6284]|uniref:Iron-regulated transcriptional activator AFT1 n=1 Tax=Henningerozyma blattae (strain ATCC 34711 / CBS 6284 / DSM 70876 / NBRC 10599 / NRRL Y-10934 / UCD 77-7) TaxID=1071380 RepID=I2GV51_HENB6|nr:hypothetical protein TBLA_0A02020 [Tetrapisispora blattae CBS 6284]CCH58003.1 hypothetical protein TBLA_0A02020 [Tetrapisispora blattae CBS 6284]